MGRIHTLTPTAGVRAPARPLLRAIDLAVATVTLLLALPLLALAALAVRLSSHGPVFDRERRGRNDLLSFRTVVDGGRTRAHARVRAVIGAAGETPLTGVGRILRRTRLDRLPRLLNLLAGHITLFG